MIDIDALLLGAHRLTMVWPDCSHPFKREGQAFAIEMGGKTFLFLEDDNDDYRSAMGAVLVSDETSFWGGTRIGRDVLVSLATSRPYAGENKVYEFRDAETGKLGLSIGTDNIDDYYPSFIVEYHADAWNPEADGPASASAQPEPKGGET